MFDMLIDMDFSKDVSLKKLVELPYEVDDEDEDLALNSQGFLKIIKM